MRSAVIASTAGAWFVLEDGVVAERGEHEAPGRAQVVGDVVFSPGFVDIQTNGLGAVDFWRADPEEWRTAGRELLASGVTSYLPTLVSSPRDGYRDALARAAAAQETRDVAASRGSRVSTSKVRSSAMRPARTRPTCSARWTSTGSSTCSTRSPAWCDS